MRVDYRQKRGFRERIASKAIQNFSRGEKSAYDTDRMGFESLQRMVNFYSFRGNARLRNGYRKIAEIPNLQGIFVYNFTENLLIGEVKTGEKIKLVKIDPQTKEVVDLKTEISAENKGSFAELRGVMYFASGVSGIQVYDGNEFSELSLNYGAGGRGAKLIANDESRLWAVAKEEPTEVLVFSRNDGAGKVTTFSTTGSNVDRAGIASSKIKKFTGLLGLGKSILATGKNSIELHNIPDFAKTGVMSYPLNVSTLVKSYENIGVENPNAMVKVGDDAFLKGLDNRLYKISASGRMKYYTDEAGLWEDVDWSKANLAYDQKRNLIYITGTENSDYDFTGVFNLEDESFSTYDNLWTEEWAFDSDNIYFLAENTVYQAFEDNVFTDDGMGIQWKLLSQATYGDNKDYYKKLRGILISFRFWEDTVIKVNTIINRGIGSLQTGSALTISQDYEVAIFGDNPQGFGKGVWGGANVLYSAPKGVEKTLRNITKQEQFYRLEVFVSGQATAPLEFKELGVEYTLTAKKFKKIKYD